VWAVRRVEAARKSENGHRGDESAGGRPRGQDRGDNALAGQKRRLQWVFQDGAGARTEAHRQAVGQRRLEGGGGEKEQQATHIGQGHIYAVQGRPRESVKCEKIPGGERDYQGMAVGGLGPGFPPQLLMSDRVGSLSCSSGSERDPYIY
jgi:hypothetical protein